MDLPAISDIQEPDKIRVVIFINGQLVHTPLSSILKEMAQEITNLKARVKALEPP